MRERRPVPAAPVRCKLVLVGDVQCGKTAMLQVLAKDCYPETYVPTVFENYTACLASEEQRVELSLWDTSGSPYYDNVRPLCYSDSDAVLLCFDISRPETLDSAAKKWKTEILDYCPNTRVLLIGCKTDLRTDLSTLMELSHQKQAPISYEQVGGGCGGGSWGADRGFGLTRGCCRAVRRPSSSEQRVTWSARPSPRRRASTASSGPCPASASAKPPRSPPGAPPAASPRDSCTSPAAPSSSPPPSRRKRQKAAPSCEGGGTHINDTPHPPIPPVSPCPKAPGWGGGLALEPPRCQWGACALPSPCFPHQSHGAAMGVGGSLGRVIGSPPTRGGVHSWTHPLLPPFSAPSLICCLPPVGWGAWGGLVYGLSWGRGGGDVSVPWSVLLKAYLLSEI
uniref:Rho family GTPase 1 n=1 Tax=Strigops habroptila TaxID=2489341 RepID=A0A672UGP4_STRHB